MEHTVHGDNELRVDAMKTWENDWEMFIKALAVAFGKGGSDSDVTSIYADKKVTWVGQVAECNLGNQHPGIQLTMPAVEVRLTDGRYTTADYLYLFVTNVAEWQKVSVGQVVRFDATIQKGNKVFPGIQWSDLGDKKGYFALTLGDGRFVDYIRA
jgi:hypothetical protein